MEARLKRNPEAGPPGYRRRFSGVPEAVSLSILVDRNNKAVFDNFRKDLTKQGSLPFWMPDATTDGIPLLTPTGAPLLTGAGEPILMSARWLCLFGEQLPASTIVGVEFRISFSVMVMP
ncbi:MAG: hypothetical protein K0M49_16725 [Arenimonas sp.]|nr:hypothetical protein [Arenimonas sp.]